MPKIEKTYWDNLFPEYHFYPRPETEWMTNFVLKNSQSLFEAAVGSGININILRKANWAGRYLGSDYCDVFERAMKQNNPDEDFIRWDMNETCSLSNSSFSTTAVMHGLEYVYPYENAIRELARIARRYVLIALWVPFSPVNQIRFTEAGNWNVNFYEEKEFYRTLENSGLEIIEDRILPEGKHNHVIALRKL